MLFRSFWNYRGYDYYNDHGGFLDLAVRAPIGLDLMFNNPQFLELYAEITPSFYFYRGWLGFEGGIGARFYF